MATATLELINPYAKYGLKRRPTYDEIANLISENETLTGTLPNRDATFFKKTPQGSFFDGTDHLEILKEEQNRILERQMREILLRRDVRNNGGTFSTANASVNSSSIPQTPTEGLSSDGESFRSASIQTQLQDRARRAIEREQQTGEEHRRRFLPQLPNIFGMSPQTIRGTATPQSIPMSPQTIRGTATPVSLPSPQRQRQVPEEIFIGSSSGEEQPITAREEPPAPVRALPKTRQTISYATNIGSWSEEALRFQLFLRGVDVDDFQFDPNTKVKGKGVGKSLKSQIAKIAYDMMRAGSWQREVNDKLLRERIKDYKNKSRSSTG